MPLRLAILGLDPIQRDWLAAVAALCASGEIELTAVAHRSAAAAKDTLATLKSLAGEALSDVPTFDDLRLFMQEGAPQLLLMDRPSHVTIDFLTTCITQDIALLSLGPPVENFAEAQSLAAVLEPQTHLLYIWPRFVDAPLSRESAQADEYVRPIRFASASWMGLNHALARNLLPAAVSGGGGAASGPGLPDMPVRSLSVLAWDLLSTLIALMDVPTSLYAAVRGTVGSGNTFNDLTGAAALTLRFPDDAAASVTLCDRAPIDLPRAGAGAPFGWNRRELFLWGAGGTLKLNTQTYEFRDAEGKLIDAGPHAHPSTTPDASPLAVLREFLRHYALPPSPHRGWPHRLEDVAAAMEALLVSHRTGQPESPEKFRHLRR